MSNAEIIEAVKDMTVRELLEFIKELEAVLVPKEEDGG